MSSNNYTSVPLHNISTTRLFIIQFFSITIAVFGTLGNCLTIAAIINAKLCPNPCYVKILSLNFCNLIHCLIFLPLVVIQSFTGLWTDKPILCDVVGYALYSNLGTELFGYVCITLNRYFCVVHPRIYNFLYKNTKMLIMEWIITWMIYPIILVFPLFSIWSHYEYAPGKLICHPFPGGACNAYCMVVFIFSIVTTLPIIGYCYLHIIYIYIKVKRKVYLQRETSNNTSQNSSQPISDSAHVGHIHKSEMKLTLTILGVILMFGVLHLPFIILYMYDPGMEKVDPMIHTLVVYIGSNSNWVNPIIYAYTNKHIRDSLKKMTKRWF